MSLEEFLLALMVFWLALSLAFSVVKVRGVDLKPFLLVVKVKPKKLSRLLTWLSSKWAKVWIALFDVGVAMGFGMMGFALYFLASNLVKHFLAPRQFVAVMPPIPGVLFPLEVLPHFVVALSLAVLIHEAAHAIASKVLGVRVRSVGAALFVVLVAAFVELEEDDVKKAGVRDKLRIFAAGSFFNMLFFLALVLALIGLFQPGGVVIQRVEPGTPADEAGLMKYGVIKTLNDTTVLSVGDLHDFMGRTRPSQTIIVGLITPSGEQVEMVVRATSHPFNASKGFMGILPADYYELRLGELPPCVLIHVHVLLFWSQVILFSLAVFNMLPIAIADGSRMFNTLAEKLLKGDTVKVRKLSLVLNAISITLIAANVVVTLAM